MTFHPAHPRHEYDSHALDWQPSLQEQAELRRERTSLARMAAALGLALVLLAGWGLAHRFLGSAVLPETAQMSRGQPTP